MPNLKSSEFSSMEINGTPYYVASKDDVPYLYDIDTREEVGYWSSKKGQYIMFSLYNKIMKKKYENFSDSSESNDDSESHEEKEESESGSDSCSHEEKEESESGSDSCSHQEKEESESDSEPGSQEDIQIKKNHLNKMFMFTFLILFIYLTLQKEFQSIYFDFIFLVFINLLNMFKVFEVLNDDE
jgi:hypothetical protein